MIKKFASLGIILCITIVELFSQNINSPRIIYYAIINDFPAVIYDDFTWKYENHDSVMIVLRERDSIQTINYILKEKEIILDSVLVFNDKWDTINIFAYGNYDYSKVQDTVVLNLITDNSQFIIPIKGRILSEFGWRRGVYHNGVDIDLNTGDTVLSAFDGIVRYAGWNRGGYGYLVIIRHFNGLETYYAHLSKIIVKPNQQVKAGEIIGLGGSTGRSYSPHLHFEVRYKDNSFDPQSFIDFDNFKLKSEKLILMPSMFEHVKILSQAQYHTVSSGDTLWAISRRYGVSIKYLCNLNGISENSTLRVGQKLRVK